MSADNYVTVRRFGPNDYRWGTWFASDENPDFSDENFKSGSFSTAWLAAKDASETLEVIEYGIEFEENCLRKD
jgi:hypothetical protein